MRTLYVRDRNLQCTRLYVFNDLIKTSVEFQGDVVKEKLET